MEDGWNGEREEGRKGGKDWVLLLGAAAGVLVLALCFLFWITVGLLLYKRERAFVTQALPLVNQDMLLGSPRPDTRSHLP